MYVNMSQYNLHQSMSIQVQRLLEIY